MKYSFSFDAKRQKEEQEKYKRFMDQKAESEDDLRKMLAPINDPHEIGRGEVEPTAMPNYVV